MDSLTLLSIVSRLVCLLFYFDLSSFANASLGAPPPDVELNWKVASLYDENINVLFGLDNFNQITNMPRAQPVISLGIFCILNASLVLVFDTTVQKPHCRGFVQLANANPTFLPLTSFCFAHDTLINGSSVDIAFFKWSLQTGLKIVQNMQQDNPGWVPVYPTADMINDPVEVLSYYSYPGY